MWHCITGCLHSLETSDVGHQVMQCHMPKEWRHQLPDFMEPHSRRWQSSGITVFRVKCKNEGRSLQICYSKCVIMGTAVAQRLRCSATNRKVADSIPAGVIGFFIDIKPFRSHYGPGVDSAS